MNIQFFDDADKYCEKWANKGIIVESYSGCKWEMYVGSRGFIPFFMKMKNEGILPITDSDMQI